LLTQKIYFSKTQQSLERVEFLIIVKIEKEPQSLTTLSLSYKIQLETKLLFATEEACCFRSQSGVINENSINAIIGI